MRVLRCCSLAVALLLLVEFDGSAQDRPRARDLGVRVGVFETGPLNAITDVPGVSVGQRTVVRGDSVNTGVTVIVPHGGNVFRSPVPAAMYLANGFGKLLGIAQVQELGVLETPIALTCTLCVWKVADALTDHLLSMPGMENVRSINPVVGETNDGFLNDIRSKPISAHDVVAALTSAHSGPVEEGSVGAGRGTVAFGWKGGIGTSSRIVRMGNDAVTVGVLVQSNFGGIFTVDGAPVGETLDQYAFRSMVSGGDADGSIMVVVATDGNVDARQLQRIARRAVIGIGRTGGSMSNGSGDFVVAFRGADVRGEPISDSELSPIFQVVAEATEEAIYNSMFRATTVKGHRGTVDAIDVDSVSAILRRHGVVD